MTEKSNKQTDKVVDLKDLDGTPEEEADVFTLIDEEGKEMNFDLVDVLEIEGRRYAVLMPLDAAATNGELEEDEAVIFRLDKGENGEEIFVYIEDDKEWDTVVGIYNDMLFDDLN